MSLAPAVFKKFLDDLCNKVSNEYAPWEDACITLGVCPVALKKQMANTRSRLDNKKRDEFYMRLTIAEAQRNTKLFNALKDAKTTAEINSTDILLKKLNHKYSFNEVKELQYNLILLLDVVKNEVQPKQYEKILENLSKINITDALRKMDQIIEEYGSVK
jgi:hypothetical protein